MSSPQQEPGNAAKPSAERAAQDGPQSRHDREDFFKLNRSSDLNLRLTQLLDEVSSGTKPLNELATTVFRILHTMAKTRLSKEGARCTIRVTSLADDAFMAVADRLKTIQDTRHFFNAAAVAMHRLVVSHARHRLALKRGGQARHVSIDEQRDLNDILEVDGDPEAILRADEFLAHAHTLDPRKQEIMRLRYFGGLTYEQIAAAVGVSSKTVERDYTAIIRQMSAWHAVDAVESEGIAPKRDKDAPEGGVNG